MLQQTQVATVIPYFHRFVERFPTLATLADAPLDEVLRLWQGLGYYSRARNLHAAAKALCERHGGNVPREVATLMQLPGIGRYTAGAIASLAYGVAAPILDGNVERVLSRLEAIQEERPTQRLWALAHALLPAEHIADFNSALMELGALVCTPKLPRCRECPLRQPCLARERGLTDVIPPARQRQPSPLERRWVFCVHCGDQWLIERRPDSGRWAGLWQFLTTPADATAPTPAGVAAFLRSRLGLRCEVALRPVATIRHALTHRRYEFSAYAIKLAPPVPLGKADVAWAGLADLHRYALPRPHQRIAEQLRAPAPVDTGASLPG
jgi:A/G-specific adenine glycosylase